MSKPKTRCTRGGRIPTDEEIETLSAEVAGADYDDVEVVKVGRRGRPPWDRDRPMSARVV
jgi:hypothetical protein